MRALAHHECKTARSRKNTVEYIAYIRFYSLQWQSFPEGRFSLAYRIQQLYGNRHRKVVHFDRLKPCSAAPPANTNSNRPAQEHQTDNETYITAEPPVIGNNLQLIDDDDDDSFGQSPQTTAPFVEPVPQRYPKQTCP